MLLAFAVVLFTIAVYMGLDAVTVRQKQVAGSLARARRYGGATLPETGPPTDVTTPLITPAARKLADCATALPMTQNPDEIRRRLIAAGLGHRLTPTSFLAIKGAGIVGSGILALAPPCPRRGSSAWPPPARACCRSATACCSSSSAPDSRSWGPTSCSAASCARAARTCSSSC